MTGSVAAAVIADSSALVALLKLDDADHEKALQLMEGKLATPSYKLHIPFEVLAETLNILGKKLGKQAVARAGQEILSRHQRHDLQLTVSAPAIVGRAVDLQAAATGNPSFIDCLVMAHADEQQTPYILGFDAAFRKNGYRLPAV